MVDNTNKLKAVLKEPAAEKAEDKTVPGASKRTRKKSKDPAKPWLDERIPKAVGLIFLLFSIYLFIALASYLFTWKQDQDKVFQFSWTNFFSQSFKVENTLGRLGAYLSHFIMYNGFGLASFLFVGFFCEGGINLLFRKKIYPVPKYAKTMLFGLVVISTLLSYLFQHYDFPFGGAVGNYTSSWLVAFLGTVGTGVLLVFAGLLYLVIAFNYNFNFNLKFPAKKKEERLLRREEVTVAEIEKEQDTRLDFDLPLEENAVTNFELRETDPVLQDIDEKKSALAVEDSDIDFKIEEAKEEEIIEHETAVRENYDPTIDLPKYKYPTLDLLEHYGTEKIRIDSDELMRNKDQIVKTLQNYGIDIQNIKATVGPTVTLYEIVPAPGVRISKIKNLEDDIALSLSALGIRIIAPIPGKGTIGIEVPNVHKEIVSMRTLLASEKFQNAQMDLPIALGKTISNEIYITDLAKMPHLLLAGATGQGKSVGVNEILVSLLYKKHPSQIKFILIDPKKVELSLYSTIEKHFLAKLPGEEEPIIVDTKKVVHTLKALTVEMDLRYDLLKDAQVRNIKEYNEKFVSRRLNPNKGHRFLPYMILVIDEFADLIMTAGKEIEMPIARLAQLARAIGIHLIIATQRPSVNIITGTIKANFPARIAFKVTSKVDSRTIIDTGGADQLIGRGDMLLSTGGDIIRLQCGFVDTPEVERVCDFISSQHGYPEAHLLPEVKEEDGEGNEFFDANERDELFDEAAYIIVQHQQGSTSLLQRRLKLGYNRAGRLMDQLEAAGIVGPNQGSKARDVLIKDELQLEQFLTSLRQKAGTF
ncbi:MAG: DNA translocase FtsK [Chitinophagales bacterium]|nr:DNA translocase FtsK [Chitinophagales bacterium]